MEESKKTNTNEFTKINEFIKVIEFSEAITQDKVVSILDEIINREFNDVKITKKDDETYEIYCRVKTKMFNPIVSLIGKLKISIKENKAKILIDVNTTTNGWFWFTVFVTVGCPILIPLDLYMYYGQRSKSISSFEKVFERLAIEASF
ncbi:MAG: hypothetical protein GYA14_03545 [Ignavibacteria bacterium]|nr:hypothetical protein [Ignavibacteria bacterium]